MTTLEILIPVADGDWHEADMDLVRADFERLRERAPDKLAAFWSTVEAGHIYVDRTGEAEQWWRVAR